MVGIVIFLRCHGCGMVDFDCQWFVVGLWFVVCDDRCWILWWC
jgi:hypothetical protein